MLFVNGIRKEETYDFFDVFGRDKIFYKASIARIVGWETPASIIYKDGKQIKIRFKKILEPHYDSYIDKPFEGDPEFLFYDKQLEDYNLQEPNRRLAYAIEQFKISQNHFKAEPLFPKELEERLNNKSAFMAAEYSFDDKYDLDSFFDSTCYWFPVDIDAILTDYKNRETIRHNEGIIAYADGTAKFGHLGFDRNFYFFNGGFKYPPQKKVYQIDTGIRETSVPNWFDVSGNPFGYTFLRDYIVTPDNNCYDYSGAFLDSKTKHYQNVKLLNDLIKMFMVKDIRCYSDTIHVQPIIPKEFIEFDIDIIETIVVPHLSSKKMLNQTALLHFLDVKSIITKVGLSKNFEPALKNILDLNKSNVYGGSKRNICGTQLLENLKKLHKKVGNQKMAFLLENEIELKRNIATLNGVTVVEHTVSIEEFKKIKYDKRESKETKASTFWKTLGPGIVIVFSCETNERFCAVTTTTKAGISINRV